MWKTVQCKYQFSTTSKGEREKHQFEICQKNISIKGLEDIWQGFIDHKGSAVNYLLLKHAILIYLVINLRLCAHLFD